MKWDITVITDFDDVPHEFNGMSDRYKARVFDMIHGQRGAFAIDHQGTTYVYIREHVRGVIIRPDPKVVAMKGDYSI